jgi:hypothetical protein
MLRVISIIEAVQFLSDLRVCDLNCRVFVVTSAGVG